MRRLGTRLLARPGDGIGKVGAVRGRRIYDEADREAVIPVWEASDRNCGKP